MLETYSFIILQIYLTYNFNYSVQLYLTSLCTCCSLKFEFATKISFNPIRTTSAKASKYRSFDVLCYLVLKLWGFSRNKTERVEITARYHNAMNSQQIVDGESFAVVHDSNHV